MKKTSTIKIGKNIQEIRKSNGYTQEKLAEAIEVSVRHWIGYNNLDKKDKDML